MDEDLVNRANRWIVSFGKEGLSHTAYSKALRPVLLAFTSLFENPMPWKVRLYVLFHGVVPLSYLERPDHDD